MDSLATKHPSLNPLPGTSDANNPNTSCSFMFKRFVKFSSSIYLPKGEDALSKAKAKI